METIQPPQPHTNLDNLPIVVLREIISYLDIGHVVPLTHVNQQLRDTLIFDNGLWLLLLRTRLNTKLSGESKNNAFQELLRRLPTLRCSNCLHMELRRRPFFDPFWNRPMCDRCRFAEKYRLITAYTAKKHYFLNENDLLELKTISKENPHSKTAGHARYFSRGSVIKKSDLKRETTNTTRQEQLAKRRTRSERAKEGQTRSRERRRNKIKEILKDVGFPRPDTHNCWVVKRYVRHTWRNFHERRRWNALDVVTRCLDQHYFASDTETDNEDMHVDVVDQ